MKKLGFTLIELLVVVIIIAMVLLISVPSFRASRISADNRLAASQLSALGVGARTYTVSKLDGVGVMTRGIKSVTQGGDGLTFIEDLTNYTLQASDMQYYNQDDKCHETYIYTNISGNAGSTTVDTTKPVYTSNIMAQQNVTRMFACGYTKPFNTTDGTYKGYSFTFCKTGNQGGGCCAANDANGVAASALPQRIVTMSCLSGAGGSCGTSARYASSCAWVDINGLIGNNYDLTLKI